MKIVEDMEDAISKYQKVYSQEIDEDFIDKKQAIITAIHHMEENPSHYASIFNSGLQLVSATHSINWRKSQFMNHSTQVRFLQMMELLLN